MNLIDHMFAGIGLCILFILAWKLFPFLIVLGFIALFAWAVLQLINPKGKQSILFQVFLYTIVALPFILVAIKINLDK